MAVITIPDERFTIGDPVRVEGRKGAFTFAGRRQDEKTKREWVDVFNRDSDIIHIPQPEAVIRVVGKRVTARVP
jgi:hypothetical protein